MLADALGEVARGLENIEFACGIPHLLKGGYSEQASTGVDVYSIRQPLGVVAGITPFNFPAMVPMWMFANALACGNTFVLKPSEKDPSASLFLAELLAAGGPARRRASIAPTACCSTARRPARAVLPGTAEEVPASCGRAATRGRAVGRARRGHRALGRRAAGRGRRADRPLADEADPRDRPRQRARRASSRASRTRACPPRSAPALLLPARPVEPDRLLDRRQRRRELRRRALLQVRLHDQLRDRAGGRAARRRAGRARRHGARRARLRPARRVRRLGGHARRRHEDLAAGRARRPRRSGRWSRSSTTPRAAGEAVSRDRRRRGIVPGRDRDDGRARDRGRRADGAGAGYPARRAARRCWSSSTAPQRRVRGALRRGRRDLRAQRRPTTCASPATRPSAQLFWKTRKAAFAAMGRISPNYFVQDGVIPRTKLPEVLERIDALAERVRADAWPTSSTPATATCTRSSATTARVEGEAERAEELAGPDHRRLPGRRRLDHRRARRRRRQEDATCRRCSPRPTSTRSSACAARSTPHGLANPGKVMPTPRLCGEVPGPVPRAPARGGRPGGAVLMAARRDERAGSVEEAAAMLAPRRRGRTVRIAAAAPSRLGRRRVEPTSSCRHRAAWTGSSSTTSATSPRSLEAGVPLARRAGGVRRRRPDARAGPAAEPGDGAPTIGGVVATGRLRPAAPPLRRRARPRASASRWCSRDGTIAQAGGKVIKNVAGYDLAKLFAGSFGTLGLILDGQRAAAPAAARAGHGRRAATTIPARWPRAAAAARRTRRWRPSALDVALGRRAAARLLARFAGRDARGARRRRGARCAGRAWPTSTVDGRRRPLWAAPARRPARARRRVVAGLGPPDRPRRACSRAARAAAARSSAAPRSASRWIALAPDALVGGAARAAAGARACRVVLDAPGRAARAPSTRGAPSPARAAS